MRRVSVIIPALNEEASIVAAIQSARDAGATEVIVVDGGSSDQTAALAQSTGAQLLTRPPGRAAQLNAGASVATGDVLLFLHADCQLHPNSVRRLSEWMDLSPTNIGGGFCQRIDDPGWKFRVAERGNALRAHLLNWIYGDQALFLSRDLFQNVGGFPPLRFMEDLFLSRTLKQHGRLGLIRAPVIVSARRWNKHGLLRQTLQNWWLIAQALGGRSPDDLARYYSNER